ncbi:early nodulin-like protein 1 [Telopea speciosissima]|uniref:early nodulin-like protein 1 n=1 Tax=Telopea speciosissima TaxID=54955 RepID=UPI001CC5C3B8|nr:early nodulin-like protein 1 [Telopea speciosissima]
MGLVLVLMVTVMMTVGGGGIGVAASTAEVHVVGGDNGWDISSDIAAWSADRLFRVGDHIWFAYSSGAGENIVEVGSMEELQACDVTNPIRMYTDGLDSITLDGVGTRFFASSSTDRCKKGLKLNIDVLPQQPIQFHDQMYDADDDAIATGPTTPSAAAEVFDRWVQHQQQQTWECLRIDCSLQRILHSTCIDQQRNSSMKD